MSDITELTLSGGRKAKIKDLNASELIRATSFAGNDPNQAVINMCTAVGALVELDGAEVKPLAGLTQFGAISQTLKSIDLMLIGIAMKKMALDGVTDEQKKELEALLGGNSAGS